jgi:Fic family protein
VDVEALKDSPVGRLVPISGTDQRRNEEFHHYAFVPAPLPSSLPLREETYALVSQASLALGRLDAAADRLPNPLLLARPALRREAVSTSALEGTYAALVDVLEADFIEASRRPAAVAEVLNYVAAAERGLELIKERPISWRLIAELQEILVRGTRGDGYDAGQLRDRQVLIGPDGSRVCDARFVPPPPGDELREGVNDWEKWINAYGAIPLLVRVAAGHYQFETLHPFSDGNGRLGRLIAILQLVDRGALRYPLLNISPWLERRRSAYQEHLLRISQTGQFDPWVSFFCNAVEEQATDAVGRIGRLIAERDDILSRLRTLNIRGTAVDVVRDLIGYPVLTVRTVAERHGVSNQAANTAVARLVAAGILQEATGRTYGRIFVSGPVMRIIEDF